jgi:hypothetical protein
MTAKLVMFATAETEAEEGASDRSPSSPIRS